MAENDTPAQDDTHVDPDEDVLNEHVEEPGDPDGLVAADKLRQWQDVHPRPQLTPPPGYKQKRRWPLLLLTAIVLLVAMAGAYWLGTRAAKNDDTNVSKPRTGTVGAPVGPPLPSTQLKHFDSSNFSLGFDYPSNWTVSDTPAKLTVTSPDLLLMSAVGAKVKAHVVVTVQNQQTSIPDFPAGGAVASLTSDLVKYAHPSSVQRAQTYVSYLGYAQTDGLDMLFLTGDTGYQQGQAVPLSDIVQGNPLISVGFEKCTSTCSSSSDRVTLQTGGWKSNQVSQTVTNLVESIVVSGS